MAPRTRFLAHLRTFARRRMVAAEIGMKKIIDLVRTTLLAGVWFLLPIAALALLLNKVFATTLKFVKPVAKELPAAFHVGLPLASTLTVVLLVLICLLAGLLARTALAQAFVRVLESSVLSKIPFYEYLKQVGGSVLGMDDLEKHPVVLLQGDGGWRIAILIEAAHNGFAKVFIPNAPNPLAGSVQIVPADRVKPTKVPLKTALDGLKRFGGGLSMIDPTQIS